MAVLGLITTLLVAQTARMITGIPGINYVFTIVLAIETSFSMLMYEGRRWRFLCQMILFVIITTPTNLGGPPFDITARLNTIINAFICDLAFNSIYGRFKEHKKLLLWVIIATVAFWVMNPFISSLVKPIFFPPEYVAAFISAVLLLLPLIIIEAAIGGYVGYKIYGRVKRVQN